MKNDAESFEESLPKLFEKFKNASPEGKRRSLKMIDELVAAENDAELIEFYETLKSELEKSV